MIRVLTTIDAHVGGQPFRLVVDGVPQPKGSTLDRRRDWLSRHADGLRRALVLPPRGHADMMAAVLTQPVTPGAHAGVVFMDGAGYPAVSGHGIMALTTIALERSLFFSREFDDIEARLVFDTPAGAVRAVARLETHGDARRVDTVAVTGAPAFVYLASQPVTVGSRTLRVDLAFGGAFYAIVDTEAAGVPLDAARLPDLRRLGVEICRALNASVSPRHPVDAAANDVAGVVFTGPAHDPEAHLRNVLVRSAGSVDLSASGTGTAAVMAVLDAMGLLPDGQPFVHEGLAGALLRGRVTGRTVVGDSPGLVIEVAGSSWITGEHTLFLDDDDPLTMRLS
jgi:proline racemase